MIQPLNIYLEIALMAIAMCGFLGTCLIYWSCRDKQPEDKNEVAGSAESDHLT